MASEPDLPPHGPGVAFEGAPFLRDDGAGPFDAMLAASQGARALVLGPDAALRGEWLGRLGYEVVVVLPAAPISGPSASPAGHRHVVDSLPALAATHRLGLAFEVIWAAQAWPLVAPRDRPRAFRKLVTLLRPGGQLLLGVDRAAPLPEGGASLGEVERLARDHGLGVTGVQDLETVFGHPGRSIVCLRLPDDGTLGLPLIRGIILNDHKNTTYKLGLLRCILKAADLTPTLARPAFGDDTVMLPLGLIALNWLRIYMPLIRADIPQGPRHRGERGVGFLGHDLRALLRSPLDSRDLRLGSAFAQEMGAPLVGSLRRITKEIHKNPGNYTTYPNSTRQIFETTPGPGPAKGAVILGSDELWSLGSIVVPGVIWRTMVREGVWIEPVILAEWVRLVWGWARTINRDLAPGEVERALTWHEPERDTGLARKRAQLLFKTGRPIRCVWTGSLLTPRGFDIDHAMPWSVWPCGDLWNLLPASPAVNRNDKRHGLPSASALAAARGSILEWWDAAWKQDHQLDRQFSQEATAALALTSAADLEQVFDGVEWRRYRLARDQQLTEWHGARDRDGLG